MAKTFTAPFSQTPQTAVAVTTSATSSEQTTSPGGTQLLLTAGSDGCLVTSITFMPRSGNIAVSNILLWLSSDNGSTKYLIDSAVAAAQTVQTYQATARGSFEAISEANPLRLAAGDKLYVGNRIQHTNGLVFFAEFMDF